MAGPGVADNGAGLAALLALAAAWKAAPPLERFGGGSHAGRQCRRRRRRQPERHALYLPRRAPDQPRAFLVLDGPGTDHITSRALASQRFEVTITGPGGHSWRDSGHGNPVHALSRAVTSVHGRKPDRWTERHRAPGPRSSFNFGIFEGGSSINSIPTEARAKIDLRSESLERIDKMAALLTLGRRPGRRGRKRARQRTQGRGAHQGNRLAPQRRAGRRRALCSKRCAPSMRI